MPVQSHIADHFRWLIPMGGDSRISVETSISSIYLFCASANFRRGAWLSDVAAMGLEIILLFITPSFLKDIYKSMEICPIEDNLMQV
jgi:hypothetical protein